MKRMIPALMALAALSLPLSGSDRKELERLQNCGTVLKEIMDIPEDIPQDLIDKAECVIVYPSVLKAAFIVGGSYGRGAMTCRSGEHFSGHWSSPSMMALEGGSFGFQIGGQATDFVLLVMNPRGARSILKSKVKLGADASAAAGPKGRTAEASTDATLRAEVLSYSARADSLPESRSRVPPFARITTPTNASTTKPSAPATSFSEAPLSRREPPAA